jgi:hypothetical protein
MTLAPTQEAAARRIGYRPCVGSLARQSCSADIYVVVLALVAAVGIYVLLYGKG